MESKTVNEKSYLSGSLQNKNIIEVPGYLKGNERPEPAAKECRELNKEQTQQTTRQLLDMSHAAKNAVMVEIRNDIHGAVEPFSMMLTTHRQQVQNLSSV